MQHPWDLGFGLYITRTPVAILVWNWEEGANGEKRKESNARIWWEKRRKNSTPKFRALQTIVRSSFVGMPLWYGSHGVIIVNLECDAKQRVNHLVWTRYNENIGYWQGTKPQGYILCHLLSHVVFTSNLSLQILLSNCCRFLFELTLCILIFVFVASILLCSIYTKTPIY
jgi:hypothetical protein